MRNNDICITLYTFKSKKKVFGRLLHSNKRTQKQLKVCNIFLRIFIISIQRDVQIMHMIYRKDEIIQTLPT